MARNQHRSRLHLQRQLCLQPPRSRPPRSCLAPRQQRVRQLPPPHLHQRQQLRRCSPLARRRQHQRLLLPAARLHQQQQQPQLLLLCSAPLPPPLLLPRQHWRPSRSGQRHLQLPRPPPLFLQVSRSRRPSCSAVRRPRSRQQQRLRSPSWVGVQPPRQQRLRQPSPSVPRSRLRVPLSSRWGRPCHPALPPRLPLARRRQSSSSSLGPVLGRHSRLVAARRRRSWPTPSRRRRAWGCPHLVAAWRRWPTGRQPWAAGSTRVQRRHQLGGAP